MEKEDKEDSFQDGGQKEDVSCKGGQECWSSPHVFPAVSGESLLPSLPAVLVLVQR